MAVVFPTPTGPVKIIYFLSSLRLLAAQQFFHQPLQKAARLGLGWCCDFFRFFSSFHYQRQNRLPIFILSAISEYACCETVFKSTGQKPGCIGCRKIIQNSLRFKGITLYNTLRLTDALVRNADKRIDPGTLANRVRFGQDFNVNGVSGEIG
ncbi:Uncharacterised protein [Neisseria meningitidis]|uniref:Uncharacterized protein n=1 Tax=Neisseria meningitidis TaxID=487 RepID=A0A378VQC1_NEIME|nr:Uncharacterised protein [Neisseria meningitidis]